MEYILLGLVIFSAGIIGTLMQKLSKIKMENPIVSENTRNYEEKPIMTEYEKSFYSKIKELEVEHNLVILPQVSLASIVKKISNERYQNELYRNIDFGIFSTDHSRVLLLIELNDETHNNKNRAERDMKVKRICKSAGIHLITFYTNMPNEKEYVKNRILGEINKS